MVRWVRRIAAQIGPTDLTAFPAAAVIAFAMLALAPAHWFLKIESMRVVQTPDGTALVIKSRSVWPGSAIKTDWTAQVDSIHFDPESGAYGRTVCRGDGVAVIRDDSFAVVRMPLADWVGDPDCAPLLGAPHVAHASWTFRILGFPKTTTSRSPVFVLTGQGGSRDD